MDQGRLEWMNRICGIHVLKMFSPVITTIPEGPCSNHPREADICCLSRSKLSEDPTEQKIENQLYSTAGHGKRSLEFEEAEN